MGLFRSASKTNSKPPSTTDTQSNETSMMADEALRADAAEWKPSTHEMLIMITLSVISLMTALDACIIITSLSAMVVDLQIDATQGFWIGTSYLLACGVFMPFIASLSNIFGRPVCLWTCMVFFTVGSIVCSVAHNIATMLVGRCVQGMGGGGVVVLSLVIFTDIVPLRYRPKYYGIVQGAWALGNCIGPVLGGAIVERTTWRWVFYIMLPFCAFGLVAIPLLLTIKPRTATMGEKLARVDWLGSFIFIASMTLFLVAICWGGSQYAWSDAHTIVPLILGCAGLVATALYESFVATEPFIRRSLFRNRTATIVYIGGGLQGLVLYSMLYYIPFFFLSVLGYSPLVTGLALFPTMLTFVPSSVATGAIITRLNTYRPSIWLGWAGCTLGIGLLAFLAGPTMSLAAWVVPLVLVGLGHGQVLTAQNFASQAACGPGDEAAAAALYALSRQLGMAIGVGVGGATFQNVMALKLGWEGLDASIAREAVSVAEQLRGGNADDAALRGQVVDAFVYGFRGVFALLMAVGCLALVLSFAVRHYSLDREIVSEHTLVDNRLSRMMQRRRGGDGGGGVMVMDPLEEVPSAGKAGSPSVEVHKSRPGLAVGEVLRPDAQLER
ncbi:hypothetical protein P8C59_009003 [Phyllachora maydis]|uniref:Major facilitator superfamily (MFS) profile domain-containing protein n=1 Tax=Phyllachora maydis TaxID=1825666 RepID=A0AAD9ICM9_9PEZI|nr:hypothetical protein P8C59_009003 [Phyllachora maydis]